ncbi:DUF1294 domain-containing protein [bacterium]|nr:MAG: DUF1294 domain-containing protein [bacterium]
MPIPASPKRYQGEIVEWNGDKRCGFVAPRGSGPGDPVVFLPASSLRNRRRMPKVGDTVVYETVTIEDTPRNRRLRTKIRAERVDYLGDDPPAPKANRKTESFFATLGGVFLALQAGTCLLLYGSIFILASSVGFSLLAAILYGWDKSCAQTGRRRVPEATLHWVALLGGWPGAALAQMLFRHKTQKPSFRAMFFATVFLNIALTVAAFLFLPSIGLMDRWKALEHG